MHRFDEDWPVVLKIVARIGFLLPFMYPMDLAVFGDAAGMLEPRPGQELAPHHLMWLFLCHLIKWPLAVREIIKRGNIPEDGKGMVNLLRNLLFFCDGKAWPAHFAAMTAGRVDKFIGLAMSCKQLGVISDDAAPTEVLVRLGSSQAAYVVLPDNTDAVEVFEHGLRQAHRMGPWKWPATATETQQFAGHLTLFGNAVRKFRTDNGRGMCGGKDEECIIRHWVRAVLLEVNAYGSELFKNLSVREVSQWVPDVLHHIAAVANATGEDIEKKFAVAPLLLSCWCCVVDCIGNKKPAHVRAKLLEEFLHRRDDELWEPVLAFESRCDPDEWPPGPVAIWKALHDSALPQDDSALDDPASLEDESALDDSALPKQMPDKTPRRRCKRKGPGSASDGLVSASDGFERAKR